MGRMSYKPGKPFTLPGGGVERGEPFDVAAVIELHEEADYFTGAFGIRLVGVMPQRIPADPKIAGTLVLYECRVKEGQEFSCRDGELEDLQFMSLDKALGHVDEFHRPMLRLIYLAHAFRNGAGSPGHFSANMTSPVPARKSNGDFVII